LEILTDRRHAAADLHVFSARGLHRPVVRLASATGDEVKHGAAFHLDRLARVVRQHEYWAVIRRILPPPATPRVIGPGATNWAEHVSPHDPGANAHTSTRGDVVIDADGAAGFSSHAQERVGHDEPVV